MIKFRGLSINGEWHYGLLSESQELSGQPPKGFYISNPSGMPWAYQIRPETIGEFVGKKDISETEIYEGDILGDTVGGLLGVVTWDNDFSAFVINELDGSYYNHLCDFGSEGIQVIGNIYEKTDLPEGGESIGYNHCFPSKAEDF